MGWKHRVAAAVARAAGYRLVLVGGAEDPRPHDLTGEERATVEGVGPFTMAGHARILALRDATLHVARAGIAGAFVECGVWRGGSMMVVARTLRESGVADRDLYLFDTFEGMTPPGDDDRDFRGDLAADRMAAAGPSSPLWAIAPLDDVHANLASTGYPAGRLHFIRGRVEETVPGEAPERIALLRLDTDWYGSTRHELECLYPRLAPGGILLIDDYGYWRGARKAVDEYFATLAVPPLLCRIDHTGRIAVKP